jgi:phage baseplate assembly protein W
VDSFIGAGIAFPLRFDASGGLALATGHQEIEEAIHLILGTAPGERPMRPEFGCGIHDYVFAEANGHTAGQMSQQVKAALVRWEPRINVESVEVSVSHTEQNCLVIDIAYEVRASNDRRNLVFPFYVIPGEPA